MRHDAITPPRRTLPADMATTLGSPSVGARRYESALAMIKARTRKATGILADRPCQPLVTAQ